MSIRRLGPDDTETLLDLCAEHARYEGSPFRRGEQPRRWREALAAVPPRFFGWILELEGAPRGFATASVEYSTWQARDYLHLDCLYLRPETRGAGWGSRLLCRVIEQGRALGCPEVQWQTPPWNEKAIGFYESHGATSRPKARFFLPVPGRHPGP